MNSSAKAIGVAILIISGAGAALRPIEAGMRGAEGRAAGSLPSGQVRTIVGSGVSLALLGGLRAWAADMLWLKAYVAWAKCDPAATQALIRLVTTVDDRPLDFWLNGARIMAYDVTEWRLAAAAQANAPAEVRRRIADEQAQAALAFLADARGRHPDNAAICVEIANLHLNRRGDIAAAAAWYRTAAELPRAPYYAARIHAELLSRLGRQREAYAWLRRVHPKLPPGDEQAMASLVLRRIRNLECVLQVPENERYVSTETE